MNGFKDDNLFFFIIIIIVKRVNLTFIVLGLPSKETQRENLN